MKFNSFIESLREKDCSQYTDNQLSTDVICIDQTSHPINNYRRELFYKYAEEKEVIQKFNSIVIGEIANFTEKKSVTHFEYKKGNKKNFIEDQLQVLSLADRIKRNFKLVIQYIYIIHIVIPFQLPVLFPLQPFLGSFHDVVPKAQLYCRSHP